MLRISPYHSKIRDNLEKKVVDQSPPLIVVGAGLSRTGTYSMKAALTELLGVRCYHGTDMYGGDQEDLDMTVRATDGRMTAEDWRRYFTSKGYGATMDFPIYFFYKDIMRAFPDVKVILTTRDHDTWYQSFYTLWEVFGLYDTTWSLSPIWNNLDGRKDKEKIVGGEPTPSSMFQKGWTRAWMT